MELGSWEEVEGGNGGKEVGGGTFIGKEGEGHVKALMVCLMRRRGMEETL